MDPEAPTSGEQWGGRWELAGTDLTIEFDRDQGLAAMELLVKGVRTDATSIEVSGGLISSSDIPEAGDAEASESPEEFADRLEGAEPDEERIEVERTGTEKVTFRSDSEHSTTWACTKQ